LEHYKNSLDHLKNHSSKTLNKEAANSFRDVDLLSLDLSILHFLKNTKVTTIVFAGDDHMKTIEQELQKDGWDLQQREDLLGGYKLKKQKDFGECHSLSTPLSKE
jgi:hypothetical protein